MKQIPSAKDNDERLLTYLKEKYLQKDGTALIEVELYEGFELYDPLTRGKTRRLNQDIFELGQLPAAEAAGLKEHQHMHSVH